jgi:hypothetical protein
MPPMSTQSTYFIALKRYTYRIYLKTCSAALLLNHSILAVFTSPDSVALLDSLYPLHQLQLE